MSGLPPEMEALLAAERGAPEPPAIVRERVWSRLEASVAAGPVAEPAASTGAGLVGPKLWALLGVAALGGAVFVATRADAPQPAEIARESAQVAVAAPIAGAAPVDAPAVTEPVVAAAPVVSAPVVSHAPPAATAAPTLAAKAEPERPRAPRVERTTDIDAERRLLDAARQALVAGDAPAGIAAVDRHARQFPSGVLSEEREALRVRALLRAGRAAEARDAATRFLARFPDSVLAPAVRAGH